MSVRIKRLFLVALLVPFWIFLRSLYRDRIGAFGCFDDCFNIMGGYFLLQGKHVFSEIFFNHMPFMAHISAFIQMTTSPESIYMLIYEHRMMLIYFFIIADSLLILRFGVSGILFALLYESTKGFVFGERFLAESIIVYPFVYLLGLILIRKPIQKAEMILVTIFTWFVIFMREPYIPLALFLYGTILWCYRKYIWTIPVLLLGILITILYYGIHDFIFNVFIINMMTASKEFSLASIFWYPLYLFGGGTWNLFRIIEVSLVVLFLVFRKQTLFVFLVLLFANIRSITPGSIYYGAFHHMIWYGLLVFAAAFASSHKTISKFLFAILIVFSIISPRSYLHEKIDRQTEFATNYGGYYATGEVVRLLSGSSDTLFLDGQDDLIYWQAKRYSLYKFSWYTSLMPFFPVYTNMREDMFANTPPTFLYARCSSQREDYTQLSPDSESNCLFVRKEKLQHITTEQWESVKKYAIIQP